MEKVKKKKLEAVRVNGAPALAGARSNAKLRVAIQGIAASFHEVAAQTFFGASRVETIECLSFHDLCESLDTGDANYAVMAIEIAGPTGSPAMIRSAR